MNNRNYTAPSPLFGRLIDAARNGYSLESIAQNFGGAYWNTGGGVFIVQVTDTDGTVIGLTEEVCVRYPADAFLDPDAEIETEFLNTATNEMYTA